MILVGAYCANIIGLSIIMGIAVYYFKYIHGQESYTSAAMLALLASSLIFIPIVVKLSRVVEKRSCYFLGLSLYVFSLLLVYLLGHRLPAYYSVAIMIIAGIGQSFCYVLPFAMMPDTIHYGTTKGEAKQEGSYYGVWTFLAKAGQAFALLLLGQFLAYAGYNPSVQASASTVSMIRFLLGPLAIFFYFLALAILCFYPLTQKKYREFMGAVS